MSGSSLARRQTAIDRSDPQAAQDAFHSFYPDPDVAQAVCNILATSIRVAHESEPASWSVTLDKRYVKYIRYIRLNVGQVETCTLYSSGTILLTSCEPASAPDSRGVSLVRYDEDTVYRAVPIKSVHIKIDADSNSNGYIRYIRPEYIAAHHAYILEAAKRKRRSPYHHSFSEGVLLFLEEALGEKLPRPHFSQDVERTRPARSADEVFGVGGFYEGAVRRITVNAYERDGRARQLCIERYGCSCFACGMRFEEVYGPSMAGLIHVHHLRPISEVGAQHMVDYKKDLRPVCPNCHATIHSRTPPLSIEEVQGLLRAHRRPRFP